MRASPRSRHSFTLVEMLVSIAIMSVMLALMAKFTGLAEQAWRMEQNRIDNFTKARAMLDLITDDLQRAVIRGDLPIFGTGAATSPQPASPGHYFTATSFTNAFYTQLPGVNSTSATPVRNVSLVSYVLSSANEGQDKSVLQRSDLYVPWTSAQSLAFQGDIGSLLPNTTAREVAPGVVGFRLAFRRADGTLIDQSQYAGYNALNPVVGVDVGLAVIGKQSLALLSTAQIAQIQQAFANVTVSNGIKATWDEQVLTSSFYSAYPKNLGEGLKTFERWVACPPF